MRKFPKQISNPLLNFLQKKVLDLCARNTLGLIAPLFVLIFGFAFLYSTPAQATAGINQQLNYQARLLNSAGAVVPDGNYNIRFKIYQDGAGTSAGNPGGTLMWTEIRQNSNSQGVAVKNGYFSVSLGSICVFTGGSCQGNTNTAIDFNQDTLWLSIDIGGTATGASPTYNGEMLPMRRLAASPYALNAGKLGGLTAAGFIQNGVSPQAANFYITGAGSAAVFAASSLLGFNLDVPTASSTLSIGSTAGTISLEQNVTVASGKTLTVQGAATFQNSSNSTTALQVKKSSGSGGATVFDIDTSNGRVGIGTAAPSRELHIAINNTQNAAPMTLLEQAGTGDATLEFKTPSKSFIIGQDGSDGSKLKISSSTASSSPPTLGTTVIGSNEDGADENFMECSKFTSPGSAGTAASFTTYTRGVVDASPNNLFQGAIYTDNGSGTAPVTLVASTASSALTANSWNTVAISASISASTVYWLCANTNAANSTSNNWVYENGSNTSYFKAQAYGTWPSTFGTGALANPVFSFYVTYAPSGSYDSFAKSLLTIGETGQVIFQNSSDTNSALQVQNAAGTAVLDVDTTNGRVGIGTTAPTAGLHVANTALFQNASNSTTAFQILTSAGGAVLVADTQTTNPAIKIGGGDVSPNATPTLLTLDNKNTSGDPTGIEGAMYYNTSSKSFRCYINLRWRSCVAGVVFANTTVSNTVQSSAAQTDFNQTHTIVANDCQPGRVVRITAQGTYSTTGAPTLTLRMKFGSTVLAASGAMTAGTTQTNRGWRLDGQVTCVTAGSGGTVEAQGFTTLGLTGTTSENGEMVNTGTVAVNTTNTQAVTVSAQWGTADASNQITMRQLVVDISGP